MDFSLFIILVLINPECYFFPKGLCSMACNRYRKLPDRKKCLVNAYYHNMQFEINYLSRNTVQIDADIKTAYPAPSDTFYFHVER